MCVCSVCGKMQCDFFTATTSFTSIGDADIFSVGNLKFFREGVQTCRAFAADRLVPRKRETEKEDKERAYESISIFNVSAEFIM